MICHLMEVIMIITNGFKTIMIRMTKQNLIYLHKKVQNN